MFNVICHPGELGLGSFSHVQFWSITRPDDSSLLLGRALHFSTAPPPPQPPMDPRPSSGPQVPLPGTGLCATDPTVNKQCCFHGHFAPPDTVTKRPHRNKHRFQKDPSKFAKVNKNLTSKDKHKERSCCSWLPPNRRHSRSLMF